MPQTPPPRFIAAIEELLELIRGYDDREAFAAFERSGAVTLLFEPVIDALAPGLEVRHEGPTQTGSFMLRYYVLGRRRG